MLTGLTLLLVAAKLFGFAHYSWLVAFAPYTIGLAFYLVMIVLAGLASAHSR